MYYNLFGRKKQVAAPFPSYFYVPAGMHKLFIKKSRPAAALSFRVCGFPDYPLTFSLNALPALKTGVSLAANSMASPVAGLRP